MELMYAIYNTSDTDDDRFAAHVIQRLRATFIEAGKINHGFMVAIGRIGYADPPEMISRQEADMLEGIVGK